MPEIPIKAYFVSLLVLRHKDGQPEVLLMQRADTLEGAWCQVAGSLEPGESAPQAALREMAEETGLVAQRLFSADICEQFYEPRREIICIAPVFVAYVDPDQQVTLNAEHSRYAWLSFAAARDRVSFGGQRRVLDWVEAEFIQRVPSPHLEIALPLAV